MSYYPNWDDSHLYWSDFLSIGINSKLKYTLSESQSLLIRLSLPLLSMVSRPELNRMYKIDDLSGSGILSNINSNYYFVFPDSHLGINSVFEYLFDVDESLFRSVFYSVDYTYIKTNDTKPYQNIKHQIGLILYY